MEQTNDVGTDHAVTAYVRLEGALQGTAEPDQARSAHLDKEMDRSRARNGETAIPDDSLGGAWP